MLTANPRTGIVSGYRTAHSGVRGAGVCTDRHPFTDGGRDRSINSQVVGLETGEYEL